MILLGLRSLNTKPKFRAADTKAASSGDCAWYSNFPENKQVFILLNFLIINIIIIIIIIIIHLYTVHLKLQTWKKKQVSRVYSVATNYCYNLRYFESTPIFLKTKKFSSSLTF